MALANLNQPSYSEWLAQNGISYTDPAQGQKDYSAAMTQYANPADQASLPQGFMQSDYWPDYQKLLQTYNGDPNSAEGGLMRNWLKSYAAGRTKADWEHIASQSAQGAIEPVIGQAALGGVAGVLYGAGAGAAATGGSEALGGSATGIGEGSASTAATGVTPAATTGIGGGDTGLAAGTAASGVSEPLSAAQDPLGSGGDPGNAVSSASGRAGSGTAMSRILDGTATTADWLSVGGNIAGTGLGIAGSRNAANAYNNLASQYMAFGAPSRARYEASMTPGFDPTTIPGYSGAVDTASKGILARLAATGGNPYGNPGGLIEANKQIISGTALPAIDAYQRLNAGTGGYAGFNAAAPSAATAGIGANAGVYNAVGSGLAGLLNPQPSLLDTLRGLGVQGLS